MRSVREYLEAEARISDYKLNLIRRESYQLFFIKGSLETVRCTDNTDQEVTVYVDHDGFRGHAQFFVYPSTTEEQLHEQIGGAVEKALLIRNAPYSLPAGGVEEHTLPSNFRDYEIADLAAEIANTVHGAVAEDHSALNAVEVFVNFITETVINSRGLHKTQHRCTAMVEAIPTCNGGDESVELYEQYTFSSLDRETLAAEIAEKIHQVTARARAVRGSVPAGTKVILNAQELMELAWTIADDRSYSAIYGHYNVFSQGDALQSDPKGDSLGITMTGQIPGSARNSRFDADGVSLGEMRILDGGKAAGSFGSNRFGQYLGEQPTGDLPCIRLDCGSVENVEFETGPYLEVVSMSGLQTDFYADYIGGEIRLAYWHDGGQIIPLTGISISGKLTDVLNNIRFAKEPALQGSYYGPKKAIVEGMNIF